MSDLMIDIETLGTGVDAKVLSVAAVEFNDQITWNPTVWKLPWWIDQPKRTTTESTLRFWFEQIAKNPALYKTAGFELQGSYPTQSMIIDVGNMLRIADRVWARSPSFDGVILSHLADQYSRSDRQVFQSHAYRKWRDVRVMEDYLTELEINEVASRMALQPHDPLSDCMFQIKVVQLAWKKIGYPGDKSDAAPEQLTKSLSTAT